MEQNLSEFTSEHQCATEEAQTNTVQGNVNNSKLKPLCNRLSNKHSDLTFSYHKSKVGNLQCCAWPCCSSLVIEAAVSNPLLKDIASVIPELQQQTSQRLSKVHIYWCTSVLNILLLVMRELHTTFSPWCIHK